MPFDISAVVVDSSYFDASDGSVTVTAEGGSEPYAYLWDTGATTPAIQVPAGVYTVVVSDSAGLQLTGTYTVTQPLEFKLSLTPYDCALLSDTIHRDVFCRKMVSEGNQMIGRGSAVQSYYIRDAGRTYHAVGTIVGATEPDSSGGLTLSVYDGTTPYSMMHITKQGVVIDGDLTVLGARTELTVNEIKVQDKTVQLSVYSSTPQEVDGSGMLVGTGAALQSFLYRAAGGGAFESSVPLKVGTTLITGAALTAPQLSTSSGSATLDEQGLELNTDTGCIFFANRRWRICFDAVADAIVFQNLDSASGSYITKFIID